MNKESIIKELKALGEYYRNDWSGFDGRTLRSQLDEFCESIETNKDFTRFSDLLKEQLEEYK